MIGRGGTNPSRFVLRLRSGDRGSGHELPGEVDGIIATPERTRS